MSSQARYLNDNAVMGKTVNKRVRDTLCHMIAVIVKSLVLYVQNRFFYVAHLVAEQIHGNHRYTVTVVLAVFQNVFRIGILCTEVLAEAQSFRLQPCLLQLYKHKFCRAVVLLNPCSEVYAEHGNFVPVSVSIFVTAHIYFNHFLFQESRNQRFRYAFVLHEIFEHGVVYRVCNVYHHKASRFYCCSCKYMKKERIFLMLAIAFTKSSSFLFGRGRL